MWLRLLRSMQQGRANLCRSGLAYDANCVTGFQLKLH
jgi:hypothetical protein